MSLSSYDYGIGGDSPSNNYTGSPTSIGTCANCHNSSTPMTTTAEIVLRVKSTNIPVINGKYTPGETYTVTIAGLNSAGLTAFGFQTMPLDANNATPGTLFATQPNTTVRNMNGGRKLVEQTDILGGSLPTLTASFDWTAPAAGAGTVTFYGVINAVNGQDNSGGDKCSNPASAMFLENNPSGILAVSAIPQPPTVYPNPATKILMVACSPASEPATILITTPTGALQTRLTIPTGEQRVAIPVNEWASGIYCLTYTCGGKRFVQLFQKAQ